MFRRKTVTISFEGRLLRLLALMGDQVQHWEQISLPDRVVQSGLVNEPAAVGERIKELLAARKLPRKRVVSAISAHRAIFRTMTLPAMEDELIDGAVERKVRQEIPMPAGETDLSWTVLGRRESELELFVVAIPRTIVDAHVQALRAADIRPRDLDISPLALMRTANREQGVVVNLEDHSLTVVVVQRRRPAIVRTVPLTSDSTSAQGRLELLVQELERTTKFYNESHKDAALPDGTPVTATGQIFNEAAMLERLAARTRYPVGLPDPPLRVPGKFPLPQYAVNLGLALKQL